jgi:nucleotide-binding universal stress UspA family protein
MKGNMKILIAYDGSECAEGILYDLNRAGLPDEAQAVVMSVAELWIPLPSSQEILEPTFTDRPPGGARDALVLAQRACERIRLQFPAWEVEAESVSGSPAREVLDKAERWQSDLIVIGSHGRTALGRFFLGSVSQKVVTEAQCSVRVARGIPERSRPVRILIGVDGSPGAQAAVQAVAARDWPKDSEVLLISSTDPNHHRSGSTMTDEERYALEVQEKAKMALQEAWLEVSSKVMSVDPKQGIVHEADRWKADCIFVGTNGYGRLGRWLLGSVSTAVVTRAHCSVEVVRIAET